MHLTVHDLPVPDLNAAKQRVRSGRWKMLVIMLACLAPVAASYFTYYVVRPQGRNNYGTLILPTRAMPDVPMRKLDGTAVTAASLKGQWLLVVVADAKCEAACRKMLFTQRQLREMLGRDKDRMDKLWLITGQDAVPEDVATPLSKDLAAHPLRTREDAIEAWLKPEPGHRLEEHLYVVDPMGEWMMRFPADAQPNLVRKDLDRLLRASGFWDRVGR